jgi:hypothetical protein
MKNIIKYSTFPIAGGGGATSKLIALFPIFTLSFFSLTVISIPTNNAHADTAQVGYVKADGTTATVEATKLINGDTSLGDGWYYVDSGALLETTALAINGTASIILTDGSTFSANGATNTAGITVPNGSELSIFGQTVATTLGNLIAVGGSNGAGIGGKQGGGAGTISIIGGTISATGGVGGAGIGGGNNGGGGNITITGGTVSAVGGTNGAGIGGGSGGSAGTISISGGTISALGGFVASNSGAAGIGTGYNPDGEGTITISGGTVSATGGDFAAGIGGGTYGNTDIKISNSAEVSATGGYNGSGIGYGYQAAGGTVSITGGEVTATGGNNGAGIGVNSILISSGTILALGGQQGAGIGSSYNIPVGTISITGGEVTATGGTPGAAGIGAGTGPNATSGTISITGGEVTARGASTGAGIGGGRLHGGGNISISGGLVSVSSYSGAGIGAGKEIQNSEPTTVSISGNNTVVKTSGGTNNFDIGEDTLGASELNVSDGAKVWLQNRGVNVASVNLQNSILYGTGADGLTNPYLTGPGAGTGTNIWGVYGATTNSNLNSTGSILSNVIDFGTTTAGKTFTIKNNGLTTLTNVSIDFPTLDGAYPASNDAFELVTAGTSLLATGLLGAGLQGAFTGLTIPPLGKAKITIKPKSGLTVLNGQSSYTYSNNAELSWDNQTDYEGDIPAVLEQKHSVPALFTVKNDPDEPSGSGDKKPETGPNVGDGGFSSEGTAQTGVDFVGLELLVLLMMVGVVVLRRSVLISNWN